MKYKLKVYSIWEFGQRKDAEGNPHQEDSLYPPFGKATETDRTFILCDGMGGHDAGEVASATVCEVMSETIRNNGHDAEGIFTDDDLKEAIAAAFDALDQKDNGAEKKMGTTMTFLKLHNEGATIAHIGDSRVYHIRPGKTEEDTLILHETQDHSLVNDLIKIGELTREEARFSKQKNVITRAMQPNQERRSRPEVYHALDIQSGDYFYMCSDGMLEKSEMEDGTVLKRIFSEQVETDERKVEILRGATVDNRDNHTAIVIHVKEVKEPMPLSEKSQCAVPVNEQQQKKHTQTEMGKDMHDNSKKRNRSLMIRAILVGVVLAALCLVGVKYMKQYFFASDKEEVVVPVKRPERMTSPARPIKQEHHPVQQPQTQQVGKPETGQSEPVKPAATPVVRPQNETQNPTANGNSLPANLTGEPQEEVVNSDQQVILDAVNN